MISINGEKSYLKARFMIYGSGYYDYDEPLQTTIPNIDTLKDTIIHPQSWLQVLNYSGKKIIIIGSGARAKTQLAAATAKELPARIKQDPNFNPRYNPWEQRLCVCPDGDFFRALRARNAHVAMDMIETVTETGVLTSGGTMLEADIIFTATGLKMSFARGVIITLDGTHIDIKEKYLWKGVLLQDIPNSAFLLGYTNASWTLGAEASMQLFCRIIRFMAPRGLAAVAPKVEDESELRLMSRINLESTYILAVKDILPRCADLRPWKARVSYAKDLWDAKFGGFEWLEFLGDRRQLR